MLDFIPKISILLPPLPLYIFNKSDVIAPDSYNNISNWNHNISYMNKKDKELFDNDLHAILLTNYKYYIKKIILKSTEEIKYSVVRKGIFDSTEMINQEFIIFDKKYKKAHCIYLKVSEFIECITEVFNELNCKFEITRFSDFSVNKTNLGYCNQITVSFDKMVSVLYYK